jgi:hypothetical protein
LRLCWFFSAVKSLKCPIFSYNDSAKKRPCSASVEQGVAEENMFKNRKMTDGTHASKHK